MCISQGFNHAVGCWLLTDLAIETPSISRISASMSSETQQVITDAPADVSTQQSQPDDGESTAVTGGKKIKTEKECKWDEGKHIGGASNDN